MSKFEKQRVRAGFTLAEVLIVIIIIGIIAILTVPALIQKYKKKHTITAVKKFYVMMGEAITLSELENGPIEKWNKTYEVYDDEGNYDFTTNAELNEVYFNKYLAPYLVYHGVQPDYIDKNGAEEGVEKKYFAFYLADGTFVLMKNGACADFIIDVNADKGPNKGGIDMFTFCLCQKLYRFCNTGDAKWGTYNNHDYTREELKELCADYSAYYCTALLEVDGWHFSDDYPLKF